jgi:hypothetical protein
MSDHWSGDGISSFTFNGKRHMTPGSAFVFSTSYDGVEFEITSQTRIDQSMVDHQGALGLILWRNGKKEKVVIENALIKEFSIDYPQEAPNGVTRIVFIAPPVSEPPMRTTDRKGWATWCFASEGAVLQEKKTEEYTEEMEYDDYGYDYDYDE